MSTTEIDLSTVTTRDLGEMYEQACAQLSRMYDAKMDTTAIDAEIDRIVAVLIARGL